jgi:hypothetical protein
MVEAMELNLLHQGLLKWDHLLTKFHANLPTASKFGRGMDRQTYRQDGDLISLFQFLESRVKM